MSKVSVKMRASMVIEIEVGTWAGTTNFAEMHDQIKREAVDKVRNIFRSSKNPESVAVVPESVQVKMIILEQAK